MRTPAILSHVLICSAASAQFATIEYVGIVQPHEFLSFAYAVDDAGEVVAGTSGFDRLAFRWSEPAGIIGLQSVLGWGESEAYGISGDGQIAVGRAFVIDGNGCSWWRAVRWSLEGPDLLAPDCTRGETEAYDANHDGSVIVGQIEGFLAGTRRTEAFRWTEAGGFAGLGDLPGGRFYSRATAVSADGDRVVGHGTRNDAGTSEAFLWTPGTGMVGLGALPGTLQSRAEAISQSGQTIVGLSGSRGFRWTEHEGMIALEPLTSRDPSLQPSGGEALQPTAVDADGGVIVGNIMDARPGRSHRPFIWTRHLGSRELPELLESRYALLFAPGWEPLEVWDISADGRTIIGAAATPPHFIQGFVLRLDSPPDCYADFQPDGRLDSLDYFQFTVAWQANSPDADCDRSGTLDLFDFLCFQDAFLSGCI